MANMTNMVIATILTQREKEVLALIGDGNDAKTAALKLGISPKTIEAHKARISHKVRIKGIANLTKLAIRLGLTSNEERTEYGIMICEIKHKPGDFFLVDLETKEELLHQYYPPGDHECFEIARNFILSQAKELNVMITNAESCMNENFIQQE